MQVRVEIESLADGVDLSEPLTRARFEELNSDLFKKTLGPVKKAMEDADLKKVHTFLLRLITWQTVNPCCSFNSCNLFQNLDHILQPPAGCKNCKCTLSFMLPAVWVEVVASVLCSPLFSQPPTCHNMAVLGW